MGFNTDKEYDGEYKGFTQLPLNVHKWSNHKEVNKLIDYIYTSFFLNNPNVNKASNIQKKHLKVVLLDLYVNYNKDVNIHTAVSMKPADYIAVDGIYNVLNIKASTIRVVHILAEEGLIYFKIGKEIISRRTAIWPSPILAKMFDEALFSIFDIHDIEDKAVVVLNRKKPKQKKKVLVPYNPNNPKIKKMIKVVKDYNELIWRTFIDIPELETPQIIIPPKRKRKTNREVKVSITQHDKFVNRVFNNGSWKDGGRFSGGFWQRLDEDNRAKIWINDEPTNEIDFKAIHVILAYASKGIEYYTSDDVPDPYSIVEVPASNTFQPDEKEQRTIIKQLFLVAFNADTETKAFQAFVNMWDFKKHPFQGVFTHQYLERLLENIKLAHPQIADLFCTGVGIKLMNQDSAIVEYIIKEFTKRNKPILTVHDSFIVNLGNERLLESTMNEAFKAVTEITNIRLKYNANVTNKMIEEYQHQDNNKFVEAIIDANISNGTKGYISKWKKHKKYFNIEEWND